MKKTMRAAKENSKPEPHNCWNEVCRRFKVHSYDRYLAFCRAEHKRLSQACQTTNRHGS